MSPSTLRIVCVAAARPNFMKIKPVLDALEADGHEVLLVHTGQHYDPIMSDVFFDELGLRAPDHHLGVSSGTHAEQTARVMMEFERLLDRVAIDLCVVVGDVNSTMACAIVSAKAGVRVAHVEAGLRSRDWAMPEEVNRVVADRVSDLLLAPSQDAVENLVAEGYRDDQIHLVGNVMIDTLHANLERARQRDVASRLNLSGPYGVVTLHRPSNVDDVECLSALVGSFTEIAATTPLVFPAHPRTMSRLQGLPVPPGLHIVEPLGYLDFLGLLSGAAIVLTDSGGVQEETTALGIPCLTLRDSTERPITVSEGTNQVVGTEPETIALAAKKTLAARPSPRCPSLWDGRAGTRIAAVIRAGLPTRRPTDRPE